MSTPESTGNDAFVKATQDIKTLSKPPTNENKLKLYGLYKQAIFGENTTAQPGMFQLEAKYKWNAWAEHKDKPKETAQKEYIALVEKLLAEDKQ
ncbi:acyl-CoA-binding protein (ACBP)/diazepam binding inhibitor (DBI)/endozepine (EP) [Dispira parvispora]|uniref:Acyl-CoA-binding protein (ACBP)/diazepam binding inhibitor (DBI)/endozepine (EP) n=1 Tax=Dispira parvispora TaxID=1520584 RepID=A0A9W8ATS3_9FUNG|nr:acyl-CoA-binding protein (ACBP)/diazepam binding inhibitor (DBI)/endozepine (EP) [Dispira parvispora]